MSMITKDSKTDLAFTSPTSIELTCETRPLGVDTGHLHTTDN